MADLGQTHIAQLRTASTAAWRSAVTCIDLSEPLCRVATCRAVLAGRRTAYFSEKHAREFERNHLWTAARRVARRRAKWACERCGFKPGEVRRDPVARKAYPRYELKLEVNHIQPLTGSYRAFTCFNHLSNLEVLCHRCHVAVTNEGRSLRDNPAASEPPR
jgi:hypothetical protein